jgi:hypothetical protein
MILLKTDLSLAGSFVMVDLGGLVASVLAIEPKVFGFRRDRGDGFLRSIKIRSTTSFRG